MKPHRYVIFMRLLFAAAVLLFLSGCGNKIFPSVFKTSAPYIHTVQRSGETLMQIAEWYAGDSSYTANLMTINPTLSTGILPLGTSVSIPDNLLKTREPMPGDVPNIREYPKGTTAQPYEKPTSYFVHTVTYAGESLSIIAAWYTGSLQNWKRLAAVNPQLKPHRINLGDRINIPEKMLVTHQKMPLSHVRKYVPSAPKRTVEKPVVQKPPKPIIEKPPTKKVEKDAEVPIIKDVPEPPDAGEQPLPIFGPK